jgi:hypothetical protein
MLTAGSAGGAAGAQPEASADHGRAAAGKSLRLSSLSKVSVVAESAVVTWWR